MPDYYGVPGTLSAVGASLKTITQLGQPASNMRRPILSRVSLGYNGTPADNAFLAEVRRMTVCATVTSVTPEPKDPAAPASLMVGGTGATGENGTAEGTPANTCFEIPGAQRTTYLEVFDMQDGWRIAATASIGMTLRTLHASYTGAAAGKLEYLE